MLILNRQKTTHRTILNADKLQDELKRYFPDWDINHQCFDSLPIKEQLRILSNTSVFITQHGSGLLNIWYLPFDSLLIEIFPYLFNTYLRLFKS